jgi:cytidylate kinase
MRIAIDGPAGAGKSTVAKQVADRLGYLYVDTGAMYRALTWKALQTHTNVHSESDLVNLLKECKITLESTPLGQRVLVNGEDVTDKIRSHEVNQHVAQVARCPEVRKRMVEEQRKIASQHKVVMDGRDIGTHVLPDAELKFYLTASIEERAKRRYKEIGEKNSLTLNEIMEEIRLRDAQDIERSTAPLRKAEDAIVIDSTGLSIRDVIQIILNHVEQKRDQGDCTHADL